MKTYRIGISGAGFGVKAHLPALLAHPRFEVVALASPSSAQAIAAERKIPHAFTSAQAMIAGCELDAITIASPPFTHRDAVLAALDAGLHVMCEKPFALNVEEAEEMVAAVARRGHGLRHRARVSLRAAAPGDQRADRQRAPRAAARARDHAPYDVPTRGLDRHSSAAGGSNARRAAVWPTRSSRILIDGANWAVGRPPHKTVGFLRTANKTRRDAQGEFIKHGRRRLLCVAGLRRRARCAPDHRCDHGRLNRLRLPCTPRIARRSRAAPDAMDTTLYSIDARRDERTAMQALAVRKVREHPAERAVPDGTLRRVRQADRDRRERVADIPRRP